MDANFRLSGGVVVVELSGRLDFQSAEPFRKACLENLVSQRVVFDLKDLNFVGSLGLTDFVQTLGSMAQHSPSAVRFCRVGPEFRRLFEAGGLTHQAFFDSPDSAIKSF